METLLQAISGNQKSKHALSSELDSTTHAEFQTHKLRERIVYIKK